MSLGIYLVISLLGHRRYACTTLQIMLDSFPKRLQQRTLDEQCVTVLILTNRINNLSSLSHSRECIVTSYYDFNLHFLLCRATFHVFICHLNIIFLEVTVQVLSLLTSRVSFYILDTNSLSDIYVANIFSNLCFAFSLT